MKLSTFTLLALKRDKDRILNFFIYQSIALSLICMFMHFVVSDNFFMSYLPQFEYSIEQVYPGAAIYRQYFPITLVFSILLITLLIGLGFYAYNNLLSEQLPLLSILRLNGISETRIYSFLILFLLFLSIIPLIIGLFFGFILAQIVNYVVFMASTIDYPGIQFSPSALMLTVGLFIIQTIYFALILSAFLQRHQIKELINNDNSNYLLKVRDKISSMKIADLLTVFIFLWVIYIILSSDFIGKEYIMFGIIGVFIGFFDGFIRIISMVIDWVKRRLPFENTNIYTGISFVKVNVARCSKLFVILGLTVVVCSSSIIFYHDSLVEFSVVMAVYLSGIIILSIVMIYQLLGDVDNKRLEYNQLYRLGKNKLEIKKVISIEIIGFILVVLVFTMFFPTIISIKALIIGRVDFSLVALVYGIYFADLLIVTLYLLRKCKQSYLN